MNTSSYILYYCGTTSPAAATGSNATTNPPSSLASLAPLPDIIVFPSIAARVIPMHSWIFRVLFSTVFQDLWLGKNVKKGQVSIILLRKMGVYKGFRKRHN